MNTDEIKEGFSRILHDVSGVIRVGSVDIEDSISENHVWVLRQVALPVVLFANNIALGLANSTRKFSDKSDWEINIEAHRSPTQTIVNFIIHNDIYPAFVGKGHKNTYNLVSLFKPTLWQAGENQFAIYFRSSIEG